MKEKHVWSNHEAEVIIIRIVFIRFITTLIDICILYFNIIIVLQYIGFVNASSLYPLNKGVSS